LNFALNICHAKESASNLLPFNQLGLSDPVLQALNNMGFEETTPIQEHAIPVAMDGKDLIGRALTGTGKTAAFGIPMVERFSANRDHIQGIVIAPTRELAVQVAEMLNSIGQVKGVVALPIYGGQDIDRQIKALQRRPQIIVGTPGRLMDHMRRRTIRLQQIEIVVLDEADEMLNMGFIEDIEKILEEVPAERQTMLFSATMPRPIQEIAQRFMKDPVMSGINAKELTVPSTVPPAGHPVPGAGHGLWPHQAAGWRVGRGTGQEGIFGGGAAWGHVPVPAGRGDAALPGGWHRRAGGH
jgi:ATP-dependent RNA helicase DeaD